MTTTGLQGQLGKATPPGRRLANGEKSSGRDAEISRLLKGLMRMIRFTVPGEPVGKGRPRVVRNGGTTRTYTPERTASYENLVKIEFERAQAKGYGAGVALMMQIIAYYAPAASDSKRRKAAKLNGDIRPTKKPDADNILKVIADALNGLAYDDDAQIVEARIVKRYAEAPRVEVEISEAASATEEDKK